MLEEKTSDMELSSTIPIRYDYSEYTYDPDLIADTARSEASSTRDYKYEHGRRYHAYREGSYPMPNDELNTEHEQVAHHMFGILLQDRLFLAPLEDPTNVIDLGTGTGLCKSRSHKIFMLLVSRGRPYLEHVHAHSCRLFIHGY